MTKLFTPARRRKWNRRAISPPSLDAAGDILEAPLDFSRLADDLSEIIVGKLGNP